MVKKYLPMYSGALIAVAAFSALLLAGSAQAVNNYSQTKAKQWHAARAKIERLEADTQAKAMKDLEKEQNALEKEWGIKMLGLRQTGAGYFLEFKVKVLDPEKAAPILQRKFTPNPYLVVAKSNAKLAVPFTEKLGSLRSSVRTANQIREGRNYSTLFANPGKHVQAGDKVTVVFGDFKAANMMVQ